MMHRVGVIIEHQNGQIKPANWGMITLARKWASSVYAIVLNADCKKLEQPLSVYGIENIVEVRLKDNHDHNPDISAKAVIKTIMEFEITAVLGLSTTSGKDLLPRIAALMDAPLVMDCLDVDLARNLAKTSQYSGKTIATIKAIGDILVFGVKPNVIQPEKYPVQSKIFYYAVDPIDTTGIRRIKKDTATEPQAVSLSEAEVIVSGGRGMKNGENFTILSNCAKKLKAVVGASRAAVDQGWVPYAMQIGQTGEKVCPKVYMACGISGSVQHFAGMQASGIIIAINTDKNAPIISKSDYYAIADAFEIVPELTAQLENRKK